jgi:hypothetical protein
MDPAFGLQAVEVESREEQVEEDEDEVEQIGGL